MAMKKSCRVLSFEPNCCQNHLCLLLRVYHVGAHGLLTLLERVGGEGHWTVSSIRLLPSAICTQFYANYMCPHGLCDRLETRWWKTSGRSLKYVAMEKPSVTWVQTFQDGCFGVTNTPVHNSSLMFHKEGQ